MQSFCFAALYPASKIPGSVILNSNVIDDVIQSRPLNDYESSSFFTMIVIKNKGEPTISYFQQ